VQKNNQHPLFSYIVIFALTAAFSAGMGVLAALAKQNYVVSQKGRQFNPGEITINRGAMLEIVNDDGDLRHHAYVDSDTFKFDSGDQEPGSKTDVIFSVAGDFEVLCAIHPKMRLVVHVK
jgi:plastocyanin